MEYTRETLIKRLGEYVGILPSELHDIACEAVELLERFDYSKGIRLVNLDDAIEIISDQQDGSGTTYEILSHIIRDMLLLPIFETEWPHCGELNSEWIPCSERLPDAEYGEGDSVLCCTESGLMYILYWHGGNWCVPTGEPHHWVNHKTGWHDKVIAWMPLPKPYREDGE